MATAHNSAQKGDFAKTVLMPGDPLRAQYIAETFLENPRLVNNVRGIRGYTGSYQGVPVSVMGSGMGMPSIGIYSHELYSEYGVENIIRVGSAGALRGDLALRTVVAGLGACTDSNYAAQFGMPGTIAPVCSYELLSAAKAAAERLGVEMPVGPILSSDVFYHATRSSVEWGKMGVLAVEMESAALYLNAMYLGRRALTLCSISDNLVTGEALTPEERRTTFTDMMRVALEAAAAMGK